MRDEWFIRGKVPLTKSEVRTVSLSKLELYEDCEFWDIGAGTGSVSVEAAVSCPGIHVCAFEYKEEAVELIRANCEKARTEAVTIVPGKAPETFAQVSVHRPDRAFIGGTTGQMREILDELFRLNPDIRIVINLIALESLTVLMSYLKERGIEAEILSMQIAKAEKIGSSHLMKGQNPIYIISLGGNEA